jgi:hypothetical protein
MTAYSITFSIPECKIVYNIPIKTQVVSKLIPGQTDTYIYNNETDYYNEYKKSLFAITYKKNGWDCLRHYEILANGCIPYFPNIEHCPMNTMLFFPKNLCIHGNVLYNKHKDKTIADMTEDELAECTELIKQLLHYTRRHLTTRTMAAYVLSRSQLTSAKSILYLSGNTDPDYLRCLTLHGFKELFGTNCHDYPPIDHIYKKDNIDFTKLYGKGMTYTDLLELNMRDNNKDYTIIDDIINKKYDVIIYGSYHRGLPNYDFIMKYYSPSQVILLCGEDCLHGKDTHYCNYYNINSSLAIKGHPLFVRELSPNSFVDAKQIPSA